VKHTVKRGFTLIELVVVLAIIAALAGLVIPQVAMLGRTTDMAASASSQKELANNIQLFFVLQKRYPQGLDSLIRTSDNQIYASDTLDSTTQTIGLPYAGADGTRLQAQLTAATLDNPANAQWVRSISRSGFEWLFDHDTAVVNSNNSGSVRRDIPASTNASSTLLVAEVTGTYLRDKLVPDGLKSGERLVAFGIGGRNSAIGKTILNAPIYPGCDGKYYGRFVAVFKIYATGERATLVGVIDSYGRSPDYTIQQYGESLPDGARQG
jgi:prepilin-type N-terminal cleavage/methylation domain-containing protein